MRRRASKDAENWKNMVDTFDSIAKIVRTAGKPKHTMNPGMRNPLTSMLYQTVIITVKQVPLTGTKAPIKITMSAVVTAARTIHPGKTAAKNQRVTTVQVPTTSLNAHNIKKIRISINAQHNRKNKICRTSKH